mgnify:CR=1 FL=1
MPLSQDIDRDPVPLLVLSSEVRVTMPTIQGVVVLGKVQVNSSKDNAESKLGDIDRVPVPLLLVLSIDVTISTILGVVVRGKVQASKDNAESRLSLRRQPYGQLWK